MLASKVFYRLSWTKNLGKISCISQRTRNSNIFCVDKRKSHYLIGSSSLSKNTRRPKSISLNGQNWYNFLNYGGSLHIQQRRSVWDIFRRTDFGNYEIVANVGEVSEPHLVPSHISCPSYAVTGEPADGPKGPELKAEWQVDSMRESCRLARAVMNTVAENIKIGMTTEDIDELVHNKIIESGAYPSPLNYHGFPKSVCTSVNNIACHGIPDDRELIDGDIISVDITVFYNGYHGDCCETFMIGNVDKAGQHLVDAARKCRDEAIAICGPGVPFATIGAKVEEVARREKVTVVPCFIGHGIGTYFHGPPDIYHCYNHYPGNMEAGMTFTIEPIVAQGKEEVMILEDGWTAVMVDNGRAAQYEHTILITDNGHEILTVDN